MYHLSVIRRFYVHNFRCLENFALPISGQSSVLLIGKNGSGKTTVGFALEILQKIARGTNRLSDLVKLRDFGGGRSDVAMRFEIEVELEAKIYAYELAIGPKGSKEPQVLEERLTAGDTLIYARKAEHYNTARTTFREPFDKADYLRVDGSLVAFPIIQNQSPSDPVFVFKQWLSRMLILRPNPSQITGDSKGETLEPNPHVTNFGAWFTGLLAFAPAAYSTIDKYLKQVMPDLKDIKNPLVGADSRSLVVQFADDKGSVNLSFEDLSDGEKCFMICALVLAAHESYSPTICFWDEPDNYLALSEVGHFVLALRKAFQSAGQFIATSHNPEAIRRFSADNTLVLYRKSHLEPTLVRPLSDLHVSGDLVGALIRDDIEP